jgi:hypothetical protein
MTNHAGFFACPIDNIFYPDDTQNGQERNYRQNVSYAYDCEKICREEKKDRKEQEKHFIAV